jgi:hypothetical protein
LPYRQDANGHAGPQAGSYSHDTIVEKSENALLYLKLCLGLWLPWPVNTWEQKPIIDDKNHHGSMLLATCGAAQRITIVLLWAIRITFQTIAIKKYN